MTIIIAHRGACCYAPENTVQAFEKAVELGFKGVEFDVHKTKDNHIIIMHDPNVRKTTDGLGLIKNLTFKEIKAFHEPNGESVPTLQGVIDILKFKCFMKIDIKDAGMEKQVVKIIKDNSIENEVMITSGMPSAVLKIKNIYPKLLVELGRNECRSPKEIINRAKRYKADIVSIKLNFFSKGLLALLKAHHLMIDVWNVRTKKQLLNLKKFDIDFITTDYPHKLLAITDRS